MKFALISNNLTSVKNFRTDFLKEIAKKGYEVHILAPDLYSFSTEKEFLEDQGFILHEISLQRMGTNPIADLRTLWDILKVLKTVKLDAVLSYTIKPIIYGTLAAYLAQVPKRFTLISGLGFAFQNHSNSGKDNFVKKIVNIMYKSALKRAHKVFFQNLDDQSLLKELGILSIETPSVIVNGSGVNTDYFTPVPLVKDDAGYLKANFLMVARFLHDKGIREYFEAAKLVKAQFPEAEFHLVGWLDENPAAISKQELDNIIATKTIKYWGKLSDVRPAIAEANVFVLPSYREGVPRSVLEAMSMGRAIITTEAPGCKETVIDGVNGFKVKVQSCEELSLAMINFIENKEFIEKMGAESRKLVLDVYDVNKVNQHMLSEMRL